MRRNPLNSPLNNNSNKYTRSRISQTFPSSELHRDSTQLERSRCRRVKKPTCFWNLSDFRRKTRLTARRAEGTKKLKYEREVDLITVRQPLTGRYVRLFNSLRKISKVNLVTGAFSSMIYLGMTTETLVSYAVMLGKAIGRKPAVLDAVASPCYLLRNRRNLVVDFRMPLAPQLAWLGHLTMARAIERMEKACIMNRDLVIAANEMMAEKCREMGAVEVEVIPNYPTKDFKPNVESSEWRRMNGFDHDVHLAVFGGGVWIREIYGLDMLLKSWKIVEKSVDNGYLVILGYLPVDRLRREMYSLGIGRVLLTGRVSMCSVANWVNSADVCLAPRTPGFPNAFYDDKDSTKISEYAALGKPIVAAGYAPSSQYLLVDRTPEDFAEGIMKGFDGGIGSAEPHYWEECEPSMLEMFERFWFR